MSLSNCAACRHRTPRSRRRKKKRKEGSRFLPDARRTISRERAPRLPLRILKSEKYLEISRISYLGLSSADSFRPRVSSPHRGPRVCPVAPTSYIYSFRISPSADVVHIRYIYKMDGAAHLYETEVAESTRRYENFANENVRYKITVSP